MKIGNRVRDTYTGRFGTVIAVAPDRSRITVDLGVYKMTGCPTWFTVVMDDEEAA